MLQAVGKLMTTTVACVTPDYLITELEELLDVHNIRALPVLDANGSCIGVVTPIDILRWHRGGNKDSGARAKDIYSYPAITIGPEAPVTAAVEIMVSKKIHHLIVEKDGELVGILSAMDFLEQLYSIFQSRRVSDN